MGPRSAHGTAQEPFHNEISFERIVKELSRRQIDTAVEAVGEALFANLAGEEIAARMKHPAATVPDWLRGFAATRIEPKGNLVLRATADCSETRLGTCGPGRERFAESRQTDGNEDDWMARGNSCVIGPEGDILAGPLVGEEGIVTAEIDVAAARQSRRPFDPVGHYARPDIFRLQVDRRPKVPAAFTDHDTDGPRST